MLLLGATNLLVFHECDLATGNVKALLLGLGEVLPLIEGELRVIDEGIICIVIFFSLLLHETEECKSGRAHDMRVSWS